MIVLNSIEKIKFLIITILHDTQGKSRGQESEIIQEQIDLKRII
ncbi:hypothetical protein B194_3525 [Serratia plymuthica A30]|nr:hypothetical protein B194_3525 [Serratia plymuthica A30]